MASALHVHMRPARILAFARFYNDMHSLSMSMGRSVADKTKDVLPDYLRNLECEVNQALTKERTPQLQRESSGRRHLPGGVGKLETPVTPCLELEIKCDCGRELCVHCQRPTPSPAFQAEDSVRCPDCGKEHGVETKPLRLFGKQGMVWKIQPLR
jgi:hypothetical protein